MRPLLPALLLLALACWSGASAAEEGEGKAPPRIYRWVDENGVAHYTTDEARIPPSLRRRFGLPTQPLERKPLDAGAPDPEAATPAEPPAAPDAWISQERSEGPSAVEAGPRAAQSEPGAGEPAPGTVSVSASADDANRLAELELRIAELSAAIAGDEDALSAWIGNPQGDPIEVGQKPEFREIAERLPKRIQELEALRRERDALAAATP